MKKTRKIRLLAFILTLCMTLGALPLYVLADGTETELPEQITETTNENLTAFQLGLGEKSVAELENMTLSAADIPASISRETVEAKDHVLRLREQEADLNTVIFQNRDGGKTVYLFGSPVKYVDANGNIRDKSTTLVSENVTVNGKTYAHSATDNFFGQYYPTMPQNGVMLAFGPYTVEMKPVITGVLTLRDTVVSDNKVTYNKVFGNGTSLVYTPTLNGVKEDIILSAYTGKSSFSFTLKTNGLAIIQDENDTFLADFEGNKVASLGDVIITDKVGKTVYGTMTVVTKIEREEYTVTVNAPAAFLANPTTVYPVTVDPTFTIQGEYTPDGYSFGDTIHDLCIYSANGSSPGYPESSIGAIFYNEDSCEVETARMLYRINPDYFEFDSIGNYFSDSRFSAAALNLKVNSHNESIEVSIYPYTADWCKTVDEYDVAYYSNGTISDYTGASAYNSYVAGICSTSTVDVSSYTTVAFDITDIAEYWRNNDCYDKGLLLGTSNDLYPEEEVTQPSYLDILQTETSSSNVYISIDYGTVVGETYINNKQTGHFLNNNGSDNQTSTSTYTSDVDIADENLNKKWNITYYINNQYCITCAENSNLILYAVGGTIAKVAVRPTTLTNEYLWTISYNYTYGGYIIKNVAYNRYLKATDSDTTTLSSTLDSYCVWRLKETSKYRNLTLFNVGDVACKNGAFTNYIISRGNNATWSSYDDFILSSTVPFSLNNARNKISYSVKGTHSITIIHKPTGITDTFDLVVYRPAVFLIHGRGDNSTTLWGASTKVWVDPNDTSKKANNHFGTSLTKTNNTITNAYEYTSVDTQRIASLSYGEVTIPAIFNGEYEVNKLNTTHPEGGNLAHYLANENGEVSNAYEANIDLYVFNYPNEDAVVHSANKLDEYLTNLANEIRSNGTKQQKASLFGKIDGITVATPLNIHIVGHSMGGLVARYYIENIGKDENVEKLITISTPHWGSNLADTSCDTGFYHELCDHDLKPESKMYGGSGTTSLNCELEDSKKCYSGTYALTNTLNYTGNRRTKYYAIAGVDYKSAGITKTDLPFELSNTISSYDDLYNDIHTQTQNLLYKIDPLAFNRHAMFSPENYGDNVVGFLSQIGWKDKEGVTKIDFERIFVNIDTTGSYTIIDRFHSAMPHRQVVLEQIYEYLSD